MNAHNYTVFPIKFVISFPKNIVLRLQRAPHIQYALFAYSYIVACLIQFSASNEPTSIYEHQMKWN